MKLRTFLSSLFCLPFIGCAIPVVGNSPEEIKHRKKLNEETFKAGDKVLVITPLQHGRSYDFGVGVIEGCNCGMGALHPTGTYCVRFHEIKHKYGHYKPEELVKINTKHNIYAIRVNQIANDRRFSTNH